MEFLGYRQQESLSSSVTKAASFHGAFPAHLCSHAAVAGTGHSPTKSWLLSCRRRRPSAGAARTCGRSWSTCREAPFTLRSARTRCHRPSLKGVADCTETSQGPFPTSKDRVTSEGAANSTEGQHSKIAEEKVPAEEADTGKHRGVPLCRRTWLGREREVKINSYFGEENKTDFHILIPDFTTQSC